MQVYQAPLKELRFMFEIFGYDQVAGIEAFKDYDLDTAMALLEQTASFGKSRLLPLNKSADKQGLRWDPATGAVTTPDGFKELFAELRAQGFLGVTGPVAYGGGGAPETLGTAIGEIAASCNKSFAMCPGLTRGLIDALVAHGSDTQKTTFLPPLIDGSWTGTMCLTEPQCGTDLGLIRTKAVPFQDRYKLSGTKIWITFGEHDLADNIVHLVLARLPDAPAGIKGISCFVVPKKKQDGTLNGVKCTGLEHKMGIHASPTCVMELEESEGYMIGEEHRGMKVMFTMMNAARLHVGIEAIAGAEIAYQTAFAFAKDRRQGRSLDPSKNDPDHSADNIMVHADVRRMLLDQKCTNEALRGLAVWAAIQIDLGNHHPDAKVREEAEDLAALLTPIVKSYSTERGTQNISDAMQVCGGAGYTQDWNIEQYYRDTRITMIYEGTNHIQALDLVGRKLPANGGRSVRVFQEKVTGLIREGKNDPRLAEFTEPLKQLSKLLTEVTMELAGKGMEDREHVDAVASKYLNLFALCALTYVWALQVKASLGKSEAFYATKLKTARYFVKQMLPEAESLAAVIRSGKDHMMAFTVEEFETA